VSLLDALPHSGRRAPATVLASGRTRIAAAQDVLPLPFLHFRRVSALIIPGRQRCTPIDSERFFNRSTMGTRLFTSACCPATVRLQSGIAVLVQHHAHTICFRSDDDLSSVRAGRCSRLLRLEVDRRGVENTMSKSENRSRRRANSASSMRSLLVRERKAWPRLLVFGRTSPASHGPVDLVQLQIANAVDGVVVLPLLGGAVTARREEAMQHGEEMARSTEN